MSHSALYRVSKTKATEVHSYGNGWGTAPVIWDMLCTDFLKQKENAWMFGDKKTLWKLAVDSRVPKEWRMVHALCFDYAVVPPEKLEDMAYACYVVYEAAYRRNKNGVNHWRNIGDHLRALQNKRTYGAIGYGLCSTSVSDIWADYSQKRGTTGDPFDCVAYATDIGE